MSSSHSESIQYNPEKRLFLRIKDKREDIIRIASSYGASNIRIFGSVARGEESISSDIDLLVDIEPGKSLLDLGSLLMDLEALLGCHVDILTERGLKGRIRKHVLEDVVVL